MRVYAGPLGAQRFSPARSFRYTVPSPPYDAAIGVVLAHYGSPVDGPSYDAACTGSLVQVGEDLAR